MGRWILIYTTRVFSIVLSLPLPLIQPPALRRCQHQAGESTLASPLSTIHAPLQRADKPVVTGSSSFALCSVSHCVAPADEWSNQLNAPLRLVFLHPKNCLLTSLETRFYLHLYPRTPGLMVCFYAGSESMSVLISIRLNGSLLDLHYYQHRC